MKYILEFEASEDWKPLNGICVQGCPLNGIIEVGNRCKAHSMFEKYGEIRCPMVKGLTRVEMPYKPKEER